MAAWRPAALAVSVALAGCVPSGHLVRERAVAPGFDPIAFFAGSTEGRGSLKVMTRHRQAVLVEGHGVVTPDGAIVLDQEVRRGGEAPTHRTWHLHSVGTGQFAGRLSDASGPVTGDVSGNCLHLRFAMKGGLRAQQWLYLQPGGRSAHNRLVVTKLGVPVASLDETIVRRRP